MLIISCKNKESRVYTFSQDFNKEANLVKAEILKHSKAYYLNKNTVNLDYIFNIKSDAILTEDKAEIKKVLEKSFSKNPSGEDLLKEGVSITVRIYNAFGIKIKEIPLKTFHVDEL